MDSRSSSLVITAYDSAVDPSHEPRERWTAAILAVPEPGLLMRILRRASLPEAEILTVHFDARTADRLAEAEITFEAQASRARSVVAKWEKLVAVQQIRLVPHVATTPSLVVATD